MLLLILEQSYWPLPLPHVGHAWHVLSFALPMAVVLNSFCIYPLDLMRLHFSHLYSSVAFSLMTRVAYQLEVLLAPPTPLLLPEAMWSEI